MAYVSVPKDLTKVKNKVVFNLTRRQLICFGTAGIIGIPFYIMTRGMLGDGNAMMGMIVLMIPAFLFAMYEKDGMPLEKVLMNMITVKYRRPQVRIYETDNLYERPEPALASGNTGKSKKKGSSRDRKTAGGAGNYGRNMDSRHAGYGENLNDPAIERRNAEASIHASKQRGGRKYARQG